MRLRKGSSMVLERARSQAGNAAAITAAVVLLSSVGANAQFGSGPSIAELLADARRCDAEAIDTLEQMLNKDEPAADLQTQAGDEQRTTRRERREERREQRRVGWSDSEGARNLVQGFKDKCFPYENVREVWVEAPNTLANAVWEDVLFAIFTEVRRREAELDALANFQRMLDEQERQRSTRGMPSPTQMNHPAAQAVRQLTAKVAQPLAIRQRMLDAGLTQDEFDALTQFAFEALDTYVNTRLALHAEIVCGRQDTFESPAAWGRAIDEIDAIMRAEIELTVAALFGAMGIQAAEKVAIFAAEAAPDMMRWQNHAASFPLLDAAEQTRMFDFACRPVVPLESFLPPPSDAPADSASRRQRRR